MAKVLAVTTSMGTKWESYSQALLAHHVPEWDRLIVDGRRNWNSTGFIERVLDTKADYVVHVDEDCFVQSRSALLSLIAAFEADKRLVAAGIPDGGHYYREHNPAALNLFFVVFRTQALRKAWEQKAAWSTIAFKPEYSDEVLRQHPALDPSRIRWDEAEPYYPLFWSLMSGGGRILYLGDQLNRTRWSTRVLAPQGEVAAEHLWYLRNWFSREIMPGHDCSNVTRYEQFLSEVRSHPELGIKFRGALMGMHARRMFRRAFT
jgi:hypothetical protein